MLNLKLKATAECLAGNVRTFWNVCAACRCRSSGAVTRCSGPALKLAWPSVTFVWEIGVEDGTERPLFEL